MSFDGIALRTITTELEKKLCGARIDKIYQPQKQQIILHLHQKGISYKLLLSSLAQEARVHLVSQTASNPAQPPLFCMVLRKHLEGGRILSFTQPGLERILEINCEVLNELGDKTERKMIIEIMGKHSNILLVNPEENKIIDALKRVPVSLSRYRQVLPGLAYQYPPPQDKIIPWQTEQKVFYERLLSLPLTTKLNKALLKTCQGLSPQSINELIFRTGLEPHLALEYCGEYELSVLWQKLEQLGTQLEQEKLSPEIIMQDNVPLAFSAFALTSYPSAMRHGFPEMSEAIEFYYLHQNKVTTKQQITDKLTHIISKEIQRCEKKAALQLETIQEAKNAEQYRLWGELLT
ncbi:MAG TPA: fibronectin/fibrinogen-binding protein, partial [Clostridia bacterium]|nr:fibronectin/fibrinogen-binding protein [Clostridia bacterium]